MNIKRPLGLFLAACVLVLVGARPLLAQQATGDPVKYWIFLKDKVDAAGKATVPEQTYLSDRTRERRMRRGSVPPPALDAPLSPAYLDALRRLDIQPLVRSRWLNAVSARLDDAQVEQLRTLPFVHEVRPVGRALPRPEPEETTAAPPPVPAAAKTTIIDYGDSRVQLALINAIAPLERGINGAGVRIGFLDTEFDDFQHPAFAQLVADGRLIADSNFVGIPQTYYHGMSVASVAVGFDEGEIVGPAYGAEVVAAITEYVYSETNQEEDNFVAGMEWLETQGVDVVNTSLGYSEFDPGQHSYTPADLDGDTGITTRIADWAASLGVVFVSSAGNEGSSSWHFITTPADGDSVIAVGAVDKKGIKVGFSGVGPTADGRIKPDVAALGSSVWLATTSGYSTSSGTSFSSPIVAGVAAQILQVNPDLNPIEVRDILRETASQAANPDNLLGWGIIDADAAIRRAEQLATATEDAVTAPKTFDVHPPYPNPFTTETTLEVVAPTQPGFARLSVYNLLGRRVAVPFEGTLHPGVNRIVFEADALPAGLYFYTLQGNRVSESGKMVLVR